MVFRALLAWLLLAPALTAQDSSDAPSKSSSVPQHGTQLRAIGIQILSAKGKPFSGRDCIDITRNHSDGSIQTERYDDALLARDSQGRIYREIRSGKPAIPNSHSALVYVILLDPVAHTRTECEVAQQACVVLDLRVSASTKPPPEGSLDSEGSYLSRESLGTDLIEGFEVAGTREAVSKGAIDNNHPQLTSLEYWYSRDLEIDLSVTRKYSTGNMEVIRVVNLSRDEPNPAMFQVPTGFVVHDQRQSAKAAN